MMKPAVLGDRLEVIVLAQLSLAKRHVPSGAQLSKVTLRYKPVTLTDGDWQHAIDAALAHLRERGVIDDERRVVRHAELADRIGAHTAVKWEQWTDRLLPATALGMRLDDRKALGRLRLANGWAAAIAAAQLALWTDGPPPTVGMLGDALIWRELEISGPPEACPQKLRAHFLRKRIEIADAKADSLVRQIAASAVRSRNVALKELRDGLVRSWLAGEGLAGRAAVAEEARGSASGSRTTLIDAARDAARDTHDGVFGEHKVFLSSVWETLREQPAWATLPLSDFKAQMLAAHRAQQLVLARADLVSAMDPTLVATSEIETDGATFHFLVRGA